MTDMPQMVALYNGMGGGAAAAIARGRTAASGDAHARRVAGHARGGRRLIGAVSFSGSLIAFGKLQGLIKRSFRFRGQQLVQPAAAGGAVVLAAWWPAATTSAPT